MKKKKNICPQQYLALKLFSSKIKKLGQVPGFGQLNVGNIPAIAGKTNLGQFPAITGLSPCFSME